MLDDGLVSPNHYLDLNEASQYLAFKLKTSESDNSKILYLINSEELSCYIEFPYEEIDKDMFSNIIGFDMDTFSILTDKDASLMMREFDGDNIGSKRVLNKRIKMHPVGIHRFCSPNIEQGVCPNSGKKLYKCTANGNAHLAGSFQDLQLLDKQGDYPVYKNVMALLEEDLYEKINKNDFDNRFNRFKISRQELLNIVNNGLDSDKANDFLPGITKTASSLMKGNARKGALINSEYVIAGALAELLRQHNPKYSLQKNLMNDLIDLSLPGMSESSLSKFFANTNKAYKESLDEKRAENSNSS